MCTPVTSFGTRAVNSSYSIAPSEYTSLRKSIAVGSPRACSGLMYASVPRIAPISDTIVVAATS
jgi:hypothetical protein